MSVKAPKKPRKAELELELDEVKAELGSVKEKLYNANEELLTAQRCIREMDQEKTSRGVQDFYNAFLFCLLSVALVCLARLPDWRTTLGVTAFCPSSSRSSIAPGKFQAWLCNLLQSIGGELELFAGIIWALAFFNGWNFVASALILCVLMDGFVRRETTLAVVVLILGCSCYRLLYGCTTNTSQTRPANEVDRRNGTDEGSNVGTAIDRT